MIELRKLKKEELTLLRQSNIDSMVTALTEIKKSSPDKVISFCQRQVDSALAKALESKNEYFMAIVEKKTKKVVGSLWYRLHEEAVYSDLAFLCWLGIDKPYRRKGYAKQALAALDRLLLKEGVTRVSLQAFNTEQAAMNLYETCGFEPTRTIFHKYL